MKILISIYTIFLILFVIFSYAFVDLNLFYLKPLITDFYQIQRVLVTLIYFLFIILSFTFYLLLLKLFHEKKLPISRVRNVIKLTIGVLLLAYPAMLSYDIFNYIATAKVLFLYHENPYIIMPIEFFGDPLLFFMHAANKIALYGPFWIILTGIPFLLSLKNFLLSLFLFKLFLVPFYFGTLFIMSKLSKNFLPILVFALNPLVIIETFVSGHNDIVMMFFALISFYLILKKRVFLSLILLLCSVLIKYATIFLLPLWIYIWIKQLSNNRTSPTPAHACQASDLPHSVRSGPKRRGYMVRFLLFFERTLVSREVNKQFSTSSNNKIDESSEKNLIFFYATLSMFMIFLLSVFREEIYPWYAIWFLPFTSLLFGKNFLTYFSISLSFGLMLRYIPFMLLGTYFGPTPILKVILTLVPVIIGVGMYALNNFNRQSSK